MGDPVQRMISGIATGVERMGCTAEWTVKAVQDKLGRFDQKAFAKALHGALPV